MKTSVERLEGDSVKLTVTVPAEDVDREIGESYSKYAKKVKIPGFRPGKAPRQVLDRFVGKDSILADAQERILNDFFPRAVEEEGLFPVEEPDLGELDVMPEGEDYLFEATFDVRSRLELADLGDLKVEAEPGEPSDEEVEEQIDFLRDRFASLEPVEGRAVQSNDFAQISFEGLIDGQEYEGNKVDKLLYELGAGQMPKEFDEALIGAKTGETVKASFEVPKDSSNPDFAGKTATFDITIHEIKRKVLPEADDDFASQAAGYETIEEMRKDIRGQMTQKKQQERMRSIERGARRALAEKLDGEPTAEMVDTYREDMTRDFFHTLEQQGLDMRKYLAATGVTAEQVETDIGKEARARAKEDLALESLFIKEGLELTEEDLREQVDKLAAVSGRPADDEMFQALRKSGLMVDIRLQALRRKAQKWLMEHVQVVEAPSGGAAAEGEKKSSSGKKVSAGKGRAKSGEPSAETQAEEGAPAPKEGE